jgi:uncharacterized protein with PQ loop repeat
LVSYLPQHYRIISRRSSEGISPYFVLLGTTSGTAAFANILILSREDLRCCRTITGFECFAGSLGVAQVGMQWTCFAIMSVPIQSYAYYSLIEARLLLFVTFFPREASPNIHRASYNDPSPSFKTALSVAAICVLHAIATSAVSIYLLDVRPSKLIWWANLLGISATILASVQYFPQLWTTFRLKHVGSLSIPMMLIQTPGSFVWAGSLFARLGIDGWSAWGIYMVTGCLQGSLLGMAIHYELEERKKGKGRLNEHANSNGAQFGADDNEDDMEGDGETHSETRRFDEATERTSLLGT